MKTATTTWVEDSKNLTIVSECPTCDTWNDSPEWTVTDSARILFGDVQEWEGIGWSEHGLCCEGCGDWFQVTEGADTDN